MKAKKSKLWFRVLLICTFIIIYTSTIIVSMALNTPEYNSVIRLSHKGTEEIKPLFLGPEEDPSSLWYPGYSKNSTVRIVNELGEDVQVDKLGMNIELIRLYDNQKLTSDSKYYNSFMNDMYLTIEYKNPISSIINGKLYEGSFNEFVQNSALCNLIVKNNEYVDLVYTVTMIETGEPQNDNSGIKSDVAFTYSVRSNYQDDLDDDTEDIDDEDIPKGQLDGHWADDYIKALLDRHIITGYPDGTIRPDEYITRQEAAVTLYRALMYKGSDKLLQVGEDYEWPFSDNVDKWSYDMIANMNVNDLFIGYTDGTFKADRDISRQEIAKVIVKAFEHKLIDHNLTFDDKNHVAVWSNPFVETLVYDNIIQGYPDNTFRPEDSITRGEYFLLIYKELGLHEINNIQE